VSVMALQSGVFASTPWQTRYAARMINTKVQPALRFIIVLLLLPLTKTAQEARIWTNMQSSEKAIERGTA
tara:strand:+ start:1817 stop:2026 length:210 start_codon:yes stop_codon:yes gene_type:complete